MIDQILRLVSQDTTALGIPNESKFRLSGIFMAALSTDFLTSVPRRRSPLTGRQVMVHPLLRVIEREPSSTLALLEMLEVGLYLDVFSDEPNITQIVEALKSNYCYALFQLAVAYRLRRAGCHLQITPPSQEGGPEIHFEHEGNRYLAECHMIGRRLSEHLHEFQQILVRELIAAVPEGKRYSFTLHFNAAPSFTGMRRLRDLAAEMMDEFNRRPELSALAFRSELADFGVENLGRYEEDPDVKLDEQRRVKRRRYLDADVLLLSATNGTELVEAPQLVGVKPTGSRAFVWRSLARATRRTPREILESQLRRILARPVAQDSGVLRTPMVYFPFGLFRGLTLSDRSEIEKMVATYGGVCGVALLERAFTRKRRFSYHGSFLFGQKSQGMPSDFAQKLVDSDESDLFSSG